MENMPIKRERIHNLFWVVFDEEMEEAIRYLRDDLQREEAKTLFDAARLRGSAEFEDDRDRDWSIIYNKGEDSYTIFSRKRE